MWKIKKELKNKTQKNQFRTKKNNGHPAMNFHGIFNESKKGLKNVGKKILSKDGKD